MTQWPELAVDENRLAVKNIHRRIGHLAVHQQRHAGLLHGLQHRVGFAYVGHPGVAVCGGASRIQLEGHHPGRCGLADLGGAQVIRQVERHQRLKGQASRHCGKNARFVGQRRRRAGHRRLEVGHDDGSAKLRGGVRHHRSQHVAIAQMQVPVVGAGQGDALVHGPDCPKSQQRVAALRRQCGRASARWCFPGPATVRAPVHAEIPRPA